MDTKMVIFAWNAKQTFHTREVQLPSGDFGWNIPSLKLTNIPWNMGCLEYDEVSFSDTAYFQGRNLLLVSGRVTIHHPGISGFQYRLQIKPRDSHVLHLLNDAPNLQQQHPAVGNGCFLGGFWKIWRPNMWAFLAFFWPYYHPSGAFRQHWIENLEAVKFAVKPTAFPLRIRLKKMCISQTQKVTVFRFFWS